MRKRIAFIMVTVCILLIAGCGTSRIMSESYSLTLGELKEPEDRELIGNQIPQWVSDADWNKPLYVVSSSNIERFDAYALENFPDYYDDGWTQKQSDMVYLGQGIEMFVLDDATQINRIIYYPVILNGVVVGGYQVCEQLENQEISMQASPLLANELNLMMDLTSEETPLILGYNNDNTIGIIGDTFYILDIDHMFHKNVSLDKIPVIEFSTGVNAMEVLCTERTANIEEVERDNGLPYGQPMDFDTGGFPDTYAAVIQEYCRTGMFPDGQDGGDIPDKISYAVYDVDGDGKDELILKNQDTIMAGMTERVYAYEDGAFREEFSGFPALTYYDNGLIQEEWSHNQGKSGDRLWPYTLYQYQSDDDSYIMLGAVDAWDRELADFTNDWGAFPDDIDADGDGYIYFLLPSDWEGQYSCADIVDGSDYENWRNLYLGGAETLEIPYRELGVETVFPDAAG